MRQKPAQKPWHLNADCAAADADADARPRHPDWFDAYEKVQRERERDKHIAKLRRAYGDDHISFFRALNHAEWLVVLRELAELKAPSPALRTAFKRSWVEAYPSFPWSYTLDEYPNGPFSGAPHALLCAAARALLPKYRGGAVHLFRGATRLERRRFTYGVCWTSNISSANSFAEQRQGAMGWAPSTSQDADAAITSSDAAGGFRTPMMLVSRRTR
jgi:hypothetical protein